MKTINYLNVFDLDEIFSAVNETFSTMYSKIGTVKHEFSKDENNYYVELALPSYEKEDINIDFENNILTISSEVNEKWKESFKKVFKIRQGIDSDKILAELKNGILKITLPKSEENKSRKINIE